MSKIIRKSDKEKEKVLLDDFLSQLQAEKPIEEAPPIEITQPVKDRMIQLMENHLQCREKLNKLSTIKKNIESQSKTILSDLTTLMKLYGLSELIKGSNKFVLEQVTKKKPLKKNEFKEVLTVVLGNDDMVAKVYSTAEEVAEDVTTEKLKCLKYKGN